MTLFFLKNACHLFFVFLRSNDTAFSSSWCDDNWGSSKNKGTLKKRGLVGSRSLHSHSSFIKKQKNLSHLLCTKAAVIAVRGCVCVPRLHSPSLSFVSTILRVEAFRLHSHSTSSFKFKIILKRVKLSLQYFAPKPFKRFSLLFGSFTKKKKNARFH